MLGGFERRVFQSEGLLITSEKSLWLRRSPRRSSTFLLRLFCFVALSPQRLAVWYWTLKRWEETSNAIAPVHLTEKVTWHCQIEGYEMYGSNNQENSRSWVCINSSELLAVVGCLVIWFGLGCLQVIEGYMSVGAVYVVVVAGASLALFACLGIYAVRQGPGGIIGFGRYRQERKTISDCMDDKNTYPLNHCDMIQKEDLLQSLVAEKSMFSEFFIFRGFVLLGLSALMSMFSPFDIFSCSMMFRGGCPCSSQRLEERA